MPKAMLVFSGYNQRAVIAFLRTLESHKLPYAVIASGQNDTIFLTDYASKVIYTREIHALDLNEFKKALLIAQSAFGGYELILAPSTEGVNRFVLEHRMILENDGLMIPLVSKKLYESISDKYSFSELCHQSGIKVPTEVTEGFSGALPLVAKPKTYLASNGRQIDPVLLNNVADLDSFFLTNSVDDFYIQHYIEGNSYYLLYYFYKDGSVAKLSQKNLIQQPNGKSMIAAELSDIHTFEISDKYIELLHGLDYFGLIMIEVKGTLSSPYLIEANPRFWGPSQLFVDGGQNLFEDFLFDNGLLDERPKHKNIEAVYYWSGGTAGINPHELKYYLPEKEFVKEQPRFYGYDLLNRCDTQGYYRYEREIPNG